MPPAVAGCGTCVVTLRQVWGFQPRHSWYLTNSCARSKAEVDREGACRRLSRIHLSLPQKRPMQRVYLIVLCRTSRVRRGTVGRI
jgi:hypothetical protein